MIEYALCSIIAADSGFNALAEKRFYPVLLPQSAKLPAATYQLITTTPNYAIDGRLNFTSITLQIDAWAHSYSEVKALAAAIDAAIDDYSDTKIHGIQLKSSNDEFVPEARIYRVLSEYEIQFSN